MPKAKSKTLETASNPDVLKLPDPVVNGHAPPDDDDGPVDKAAEVLAEIKRKSSEIVVREQLAAPFYPDELTQMSGGYYCVRPVAVAQRLDDVLGIDGWDLYYLAGPDKSFVASLAIRVNHRVVTRSVAAVFGTPYCDPLVACAFQFGVGRYLAKVPPGPLPDWALPKAPGKDRVPYYDPARAKPPEPKPEPPKQEAPKPAPAPSPPPPPVEAASGPATQKEPVTQAEWVKLWTDRAKAAHTPDELNQHLPKLARVPKDYKRAVWNAVKEIAFAQDWEYDADQQCFLTVGEPDGGQALEW